MRISDGSLERVKEAADILSVASDFGTFKRQGSDYVALCLYPDHKEKTPSFSVTPGKNLFHCWGCLRGGDAIKLVMDLTGAEFGEAVEHLADRFGVEIEYEGGDGGGGAAARAREGRKEALRALAAAAEDYHAYLTRSPDTEALGAREYLSGRGISGETLSLFRVGYAPSSDSGKGFVATAGKRHGLGGDALAAAGLERYGEDRFAGRMVFPVTDARGRTVGFGGRVLPDAPEFRVTRAGKKTKNPKYENSPESPLYEKRRLLYGLDAALPAIREGRRAVVVEGYTDVLMAHQAGVKDVVATCGTALTPEHLRLLAPHAETVVLVFDPDTAGVRAVERAREAAEREMDLRAATLDADPADWLQGRASPGEEFEALLAAAPGVVEWQIRGIADGARDGDAMTRQRALSDVQALMAELPEGKPVLRQEAARLAARAFGVSVGEVLAGVGTRPDTRPGKAGAAPRGNPESRAERYLLSACLAYPEDAAPVLAGGMRVEGIEEPVVLSREDFEGEDLAALYAEVSGRAKAGRPFVTTDLVADEALRGHHALIAALDAEAEEAPEGVRAAVVREAYLRVAMLSRRRQRADTDDEDPAWDRLYAEERLIEGEVARCADAAAL